MGFDTPSFASGAFLLLLLLSFPGFEVTTRHSESDVPTRPE
jgi:hypothetical protein